VVHSQSSPGPSLTPSHTARIGRLPPLATGPAGKLPPQVV
jgi:hypothetical protein